MLPSICARKRNNALTKPMAPVSKRASVTAGLKSPKHTHRRVSIHIQTTCTASNKKKIQHRCPPQKKDGKNRREIPKKTYIPPLIRKKIHTFTIKLNPNEKAT